MEYDIYITGEISQKSFRIFSKKLSEIAEHKNKIKILLNSDGGDAYAALAFFDFIKAYANNSYYIRIDAIGLVASAAVVILASGSYKNMFSSAWVMVHEDSVAIEEGMNVSQIERDAAHSRRLEDQWSTILASVTKADKQTWDRLHKAETYLNAKECLELGLIDQIIGD